MVQILLQHEGEQLVIKSKKQVIWRIINQRIVDIMLRRRIEEEEEIQEKKRIEYIDFVLDQIKEEQERQPQFSLDYLNEDEMQHQQQPNELNIQKQQKEAKEQREQKSQDKRVMFPVLDNDEEEQYVNPMMDIQTRKYFQRQRQRQKFLLKLKNELVKDQA